MEPRVQAEYVLIPIRASPANLSARHRTWNKRSEAYRFFYLYRIGTTQLPKLVDMSIGYAIKLPLFPPPNIKIMRSPNGIWWISVHASYVPTGGALEDSTGTASETLRRIMSYSTKSCIQVLLANEPRQIVREATYLSLSPA